MIKRLILRELSRAGVNEAIDRAKDAVKKIRRPEPTYQLHIAANGDGDGWIETGYGGYGRPNRKVALCGRVLNQFMFDSAQHAIERIDDPDHKADGVCPDCWNARPAHRGRDKYGRL